MSQPTTTFEASLGQRGPEIVRCAHDIVRVMEQYADPFLGYDLALIIYEQRDRISKDHRDYSVDPPTEIPAEVIVRL